MLFVGGSQNGKWIEVPDGRIVWDTSHLNAETVETYRKISISLCEMMVIDYLSVGEVIPRLMGNYKPEVKP